MKKLTEDERKIEREELDRLTDPLIKFLNANYHPHVYLIISPTRVELVEGIMSINNDQHIKD